MTELLLPLLLKSFALPHDFIIIINGKLPSLLLVLLLLKLLIVTEAQILFTFVCQQGMTHCVIVI